MNVQQLITHDKPSKNWPGGVPWVEWVAAKYQPANLGDRSAPRIEGMDEGMDAG
jgi:hypothetical protein